MKILLVSNRNPHFMTNAERMPDHQFVMIGERLDGEGFRLAYQIDISKNLRLMGSIRHAEVLDAMAACKGTDQQKGGNPDYAS